MFTPINYKDIILIGPTEKRSIKTPLCLISLIVIFPLVYFSVLKLTEDHNLSIFTAVYITLLSLLVFVKNYLKQIQPHFSGDPNNLSEDEVLHHLSKTILSKPSQHPEQNRNFKNPSPDEDKNRKRLQFVLNTSEEGLWEWEPQTGAVVLTQKSEQILGFKSADYDFHRFEQSILEQDRARVNQALLSLMENNEPYDLEFRIQKPDGSVIWIWDRCGVAEYNDQGKAIWIIGIIQDITRDKLNQEKIRSLAYFDTLTKLPNRTLLQKNLETILQAKEQTNPYSALLLLDLNKFKLLNDTYGHDMGDKLLAKIAKRLTNEVGSKGTVTRFSNDEFILIFPNLSNNIKLATVFAQNFAQRIHVAISKPTTLKHYNININYSISPCIGGIVFDSSETSADNLIRLSGLALDKAKENTGSGIKIYNSENQSELDNANLLQKTFHQSFTNNEFCIYLQPKFNASQKLTGAEATLRWQHPHQGLLLPDTFMYIADKTNLIIPLGNQVLEKACKILVEWQSQPETAHLNLSVNLSSKQIWHLNFVSEVSSVIEKYHFDRSKLILEVTESSLLEDADAVINKLKLIKEMGIKLSLDSFGTKYSSLNYLLEMSVDEIKIDRSFIKNIVGKEQAYLMVNSIMSIAENFKLNVVSEGVETKAQFELLKKNKVDTFQGYYFDMPMPVEQFKNLTEELKSTTA